MKLYLVRHGEALPADKNPERPLSEKGRKDVQKVGQELARRNVTCSEIWHSRKLRAVETAHFLAEILQIPEVCRERDGLNPNDPVEAVKWDIEDFIQHSPGSDLMIVGHLPLLADLAFLLLGSSASAEKISFEAGSVIVLECSDANRGLWEHLAAVHPSKVVS